MPLIGAGAGGEAIYTSVIGDYAQIPNVHPVTVFPGTADYTVSNLSGLNSALSSATAGQTIECLNGNYGDWYPDKVNAGADIRVFCRDMWGAVFDLVHPQQDFDGVQFENLNVGWFACRYELNPRSFQLIGCWARYFYVQHNYEEVFVSNCVIDRNLQNLATCATINFMHASVTFHQCIFAQAGGDLIQVKGMGHSAGQRITFTECAMWGIRSYWDDPVANPGNKPHSDILQFALNTGIGTGRYTMEKCVAWSHYSPRGTQTNYPEQTNDGFLIGDGPYYDSIIDSCYLYSDGFNNMAARNTTGTISDCIVPGKISGTGDATNLGVHDCLAETIAGDTAFAGTSGNYSGSLAGITTNTTGNYTSWRDYITTDQVAYPQGQAFLNTVAALWDGAPVSTPSPLMLNGSPLMLNGSVLHLTA